MRVLFIGGTGNLSYECTVEALERGLEVYHLNRGTRAGRSPAGAVTLNADVRDPGAVKSVTGDLRFDAVVDFISYTPEQVRLSLEGLAERCRQWVFISSASAYRKPPSGQVVTESTPLENPYWAYSRAKIACEREVAEACAARGLGWTVIRPSHTYGLGWVPSSFGSADFTIAARMLAGKEVVVHGDGQSLWTITHARDFAVGLVGLLGQPAALGEAFQITGEEALTWDAIHRAVGAALGVEPRLVHVPSELIAAVDPAMGERLLGDKAWTSLFDCSKVKRLVPEFRTRTPFARGLRESIEWLMADPARRRVDPALDALVERVLAAWRRAREAALEGLPPPPNRDR